MQCAKNLATALLFVDFFSALINAVSRWAGKIIVGVRE
jgi:hypothetical protein